MTVKRVMVGAAGVDVTAEGVTAGGLCSSLDGCLVCSTDGVHEACAPAAHTHTHARTHAGRANIATRTHARLSYCYQMTITYKY